MNAVPVFYPINALELTADPLHPESPDRLKRLIAALETQHGPGLLRPCRSTGKERPESWLPHPPSYWQALRDAIDSGASFFGSQDTRIHKQTFDLLAEASTTVAAALATVCEEHAFQRKAFALVRPPGHHASLEHAQGFCILNHAAVAAWRARMLYGLSRVAILDWDAHHGNGTDAITADEHSTLLISLHQHPYYPFTGEASGSVDNAIEGRNMSIPLEEGSTITHFVQAMEQMVLPALLTFKPELLIISCGFDAHREDPMSGLKLESKDFETLTRMLCATLDVPMLSILEGGYSIPAVIESAQAHLRGFG